MISKKLLKEFETAVKSVYQGKQWGPSLSWDFQQDVVQELCTDYVVDRSFRTVLGECANRAHRYSILSKRAQLKFSQIKDQERLAGNENLYSVESVKALLKDASTNRQMLTLLPVAMDALRERHEGYADAIASRYGDGVIPESKLEQNLLVRAHPALTEEINRASRMLGENRSGPSLSNAVPAEERSAKGGSGDPTGDAAINNIMSGELREEFYTDHDDGIPVGKVGDKPTNLVGWNIFDPEFQGMQNLDNYRASVFPELYPHENAIYRGTDNGND